MANQGNRIHFIDVSGAQNSTWNEAFGGAFFALVIASFLSLPLSSLGREYEWLALPVMSIPVFAFCCWRPQWRSGTRRRFVQVYSLQFGAIARAVSNLDRPFLERPRVWSAINWVAALSAPFAWGTFVYFAGPREAANTNDLAFAIGGILAFAIGGILLALNAIRLWNSRASLVHYATSTAATVGLGLVPRLALISVGAVASFWLVWLAFMLVPGMFDAYGSPIVPLPGGVASLVMAAVGAYLWQRTKWLFRTRAMAGAHALALPSLKLETHRDGRQPVLLLRSFSDDRLIVRGTRVEQVSEIRLEEALSPVLRKLGPFVTIGEPGELAVAGAARAQYPEQVWRTTVEQLMDRASMIVLFAGLGENLQWEISTLLARGHMSKLVIVLPRTDLRARLSAAWRALHQYADVLGDAQLGKPVMVHFTRGGDAIVFQAEKATAHEFEAAMIVASYGVLAK